MTDVLQVENLSISFGGLKALDDLSFTVSDHEIFGLIGPNGAGKTTVFNCVTQFYRPDTGTVWFAPGVDRLVRAGHAGTDRIDLVGQPVHRVIRYGLVRTFQNVEIIPELTVLDNVLIGGHVDFRSSMIAQMLRLPRARAEEAQYREKAREALRFLSIEHLADQLAGGQPYGVRKRLEMARTLMAEPRLIILDEPAAGLNESETEDLADTIRRIRDTFGCSVLLVEHDMGLVMDVCDQICAISFGKFLASGTPVEIQRDVRVHEAYLGERDDA
ncbi:ABC transporter ATP-binding protein [Isoptericola sp. b441]|uniref:ABC transporter ATP-binding protein n=1 Tax=Actinotalea lenta TaxID=3064654 RepID=A0ABT9D9M4_9CELL|nr:MULTISPECIES: ABC transporter ATP-binding protein [unclassified Isoptericola]MDO8107595.1 ABC transporter ATP-binding protein [Isoptericola sp. b441]MDO8120745.1 ABC transporter ATP-binding protein [Isoptericola sp. b490]